MALTTRAISHLPDHWHQLERPQNFIIYKLINFNFVQSEKYSATNAYHLAFVYYLWQRNGFTCFLEETKVFKLHFWLHFTTIGIVWLSFGCRLAVVCLS
jgi:hypothetical protein